MQDEIDIRLAQAEEAEAEEEEPVAPGLMESFDLEDAQETIHALYDQLEELNEALQLKEIENAVLRETIAGFIE